MGHGITTETIAAVGHRRSRHKQVPPNVAGDLLVLGRLPGETPRVGAVWDGGETLRRWLAWVLAFTAFVRLDASS
jgi:hypothetical protein